MSEDKKPLTPLQLRAISHMLNEPTLGAAAKLAGVNVKTLQRWRDEPQFAAELRRTEADVMRDAVRMLTGTMALAADTVKQIMADDESTPSEKLRAALGVLGLVTALRDKVDFEARLAALEMAQSGD